MIYLYLILTALIPIAATILFDLLLKKTKFAELSKLAQQIIIGIFFGLVAIACTELGQKTYNITASITHVAPLLAGVVFGGPAGLIAAGIGALERGLGVLWGHGKLDQLASIISILFSGAYALFIRKFFFDNKRPTWGFTIAITIVLEVLHFILIFLFNVTNPTDAMSAIRVIYLPVTLAAIIATFASIFVLQLFSKKNVNKDTKSSSKPKMSTQVQIWLLASIVVCYLISTLIVYVVQTNSAYQSADTTFNLTINDVKDDVNDASNSYLSPILDDVIERYNQDPYQEGKVVEYAQKLHNLMTGPDSSYKLASVDLISLTSNGGRGDFICSSDIEWGEGCGYKYDFFMTQFPGQSYDLHQKMIEYSAKPYKAFIQEFGKRADDTRGVYYLKYAARRINDQQYIAISIDADVFYGYVNTKIADITSYRHVNNTGHIIIMQYDGTVVSNNSDPRFAGKVLETEIKELSDESKQFTRQRGTIYQEDCFYMYCFAETYKVVVVLPSAEVLSTRDTSFILNTFMEILVFAVLYTIIYFLLKRKVVAQIEHINTSLGKIIEGDLQVKIDVNSSYEFASLSDDINYTVDTLKDYISEAEKRIDTELAFAKTIQTNALPSVFPAFPDKPEFDIYASMDTAKEVGGDFYDFYIVDKNKLAFLIADVSGKGIPAAMFMMESKATIKNLAKGLLSVDEVLTKANETLAQNNKANMFVTCWFGILDFGTGHVTFANAGHNYPLLYSDGSWKYVAQKKNMVLAAIDGIKYTLQEFDMKPGDKLYLYTDGVTEATRSDNALYGEDRLIKYLNNHKDDSIKDTLGGVKADLDKFIEGADQFDDITMLALEYKGKK